MENKQMEYSEKILTEINREYDRKRQEYIEIDKKIVQLIIINSILLALFVEFISFPKKDIYGIILYIIVILLIMGCICFLLRIYIPKSFQVIDPRGINKEYNFKGLKGYNLFLRKIPNGIIHSYEKLERIINKKDKWIKRLLLLFFLSLTLFMIIGIIQQIG